jgi:hypothetical protein
MIKEGILGPKRGNTRIKNCVMRSFKLFTDHQIQVLTSFMIFTDHQILTSFMMFTDHRILTSFMIFTRHQIITSFTIFTRHQILTSSSNQGQGNWHTWRTESIQNVVRESGRGRLEGFRVAGTSNIKMWSERNGMRRRILDLSVS